MRAVGILVLAAGLALGGCSTTSAIFAKRPALFGKKSTDEKPAAPKKMAAMPTRPACPAMKNDEWGPMVQGAIHKTFDRQLQKRFGDTGTHVRLDWSKDFKGNTVITARRIGPAKYAMPEVGKGGEVELVVQACTGKLLKTHKLANLERRPQPLPAAN